MEKSESQNKSINPTKNPIKTENNKKNSKKKRKIVSGYVSDTASSSSCLFSKGIRVTKNKNNRNKAIVGSKKNNLGDVDSIALPLGMSLAAVVAQVLERRESTGGAIAVDQLSKICNLAVRESLANVFGDDKFDTFAGNFEKSFRSTLMTLRLINETSQCSGEQDVVTNGENTLENAIPSVSFYKDLCFTGRSEEYRGSFEESSSDQNARSDLVTGQKDLIDGERNYQLACVSRCSTLSTDNGSMLNIYEKSLMEQTRANDLKTFEISLGLKKLQVKEELLALNRDSNLLERMKLSMGVSKASFRAYKFRYEVKETRHAELLKKCIDCLVASLVIMLALVAYGTKVFAHSKITEATASCMPFKESKSWWMPKQMATMNSVMMILWCQVQVFSRLIFGAVMIVAITYLLLQRSTSSTQTMPITFILLLGFACGVAGKLCIDALGGNGYRWLMYWEVLCILHFLANVFVAALFFVLYGPISVSHVVAEKTRFPYWLRRQLCLFIALVVLPVLCGLMPFASPSEWKEHFKCSWFIYC